MSFVRRTLPVAQIMLDACLTLYAAHLNRLLMCIQLDTLLIRERDRPHGRFR